VSPTPYYADDAVMIWHGNALDLGMIPDGSVDLVCTSPPYWSLRSYQDGGEHYDGQIGSEEDADAYIDQLLRVHRECSRVMKPGGSQFWNLGDKYGPDKSLMMLPQRFADAVRRGQGGSARIVRAEVIWSKPNGLPESVTDRVRRSHETWWHFTRQPRYFSAVDEIREPNSDHWLRYSGRKGGVKSDPSRKDAVSLTLAEANPLGKLPGSVWEVPAQPLKVPANLTQHFAAFPLEWPRRIIQGWSPSGRVPGVRGRPPARGRPRQDVRREADRGGGRL
jgi:DNA modification methylase